MFWNSAHIADLKAQLTLLERLLSEERAEKRHLLDCLLQRHNASPVTPQPPIITQAPVQLISPFGGGATPEMNEAARQSWLDEEAAYLMAEHKYPEDQAKAMAEERWRMEHRA